MNFYKEIKIVCYIIFFFNVIVDYIECYVSR